MKTLYVHRPLLNAEELVVWAKREGFPKTLTEDDMHVTVAYSKAKLNWDDLDRDTNEVEVPRSFMRNLAVLGEDANVLKFKSPSLHHRWEYFRKHGASWDYDSYQPHVTIMYGTILWLRKIEPYFGRLVFGSEIFEELNENWKAKEK